MAEPYSILIIASRLPRAVGKGDSMTTYHLVKYMASRGHRVHLVSFVGVDRFLPTSLESYLDELRPSCASIDLIPVSHGLSRLKALRGLASRDPLQVWYFRYPEMQRAVDRVIAEHRPDVLYAHNFRTAQYLWNERSAPTVSGLMLSYALNYERMAQYSKSLLRRMFWSFECRRLRTYESRILEAYDRVLLISPHDKAAVHDHERHDNVFFNPHGLDVAHFTEDLGVAKVPNSLIMSGDFGYPPNWDAALWFHGEILPRVRQSVPDARLWLVGREPTKAVQALTRDPLVKVTGWVDDLREHLQAAEVAVVPVRIAAGMQNKLVINMGSGLPVVATTAANEGIRAVPGRHFLAADRPEDFADAVVALLKDRAKREELGASARRFVERYWSWEYHFEKLEGMLQQLIERGPEAPIEQYMTEGFGAD